MIEKTKIWLQTLGYTALGFVLTGVVFRELALSDIGKSEIPSFIPEKYFYTAMGVAIFLCFAQILTVKGKLENLK